MGLTVHVGMLAMLDEDPEGLEWYQDHFARLSQALATQGVTWQEPEGDRGSAVSGCFYSDVFSLKRAYTLVIRGEPVTPSTERMTPADEQLVMDEVCNLQSHLLCHSDCEGFYIPVPLAEPLFLEEDWGIPGDGSVGSSQGLLAELLACASAIGVRLDGDRLPEGEAARLDATPEGAPYASEIRAWLALYEAATASIDSGHAIVFS